MILVTAEAICSHRGESYTLLRVAIVAQRVKLPLGISASCIGVSELSLRYSSLIQLPASASWEVADKTA